MTVEPYGYGTLIVEPIAGDGETATGIVLQHHVGLPKVYARVLAAGDGADGIRQDDLIVMYPHAEEEIEAAGYRFFVVNAASVRGVINGENGAPYFAEDAA